MRRVPCIRRLDVIVADVALLLEQAGDFLPHPRGLNPGGVVSGAISVANPAEHVCNGISQHLLVVPFSSLSRAKRRDKPARWKMRSIFIVTTSCFSSCPGSSRRARGRAGRSGRSRTCRERGGGGRGGG